MNNIISNDFLLSIFDKQVSTTGTQIEKNRFIDEDFSLILPIYTYSAALGYGYNSRQNGGYLKEFRKIYFTINDEKIKKYGSLENSIKVFKEFIIKDNSAIIGFLPIKDDWREQNQYIAINNYGTTNTNLTAVLTRLFQDEIIRVTLDFNEITDTKYILNNEQINNIQNYLLLSTLKDIRFMNNDINLLPSLLLNNKSDYIEEHEDDSEEYGIKEFKNIESISGGTKKNRKKQKNRKTKKTKKTKKS